MPSSYNNDLRIEEQATGENSGDWGTKLSASINQISSALSYGSEAIADASTHTITMADGTADEARSLYLKCTGGGQACTVTLAPNTVSKVWFIENATSYTLTFSQGSGANVAVLAGQVKVIATDGGGSGAVVYDAFTDLSLAGTLSVAGAITSSAGATITTSDNSDNLTLTSTDADASFGPNLRLYRNSGSPADDDMVGNIEFEGRNDNSQDVVYGRLFTKISDASDGTEDGIMRFDIMKAGSLSDVLTFTPDELAVNDGSYIYDFRVESNNNANALKVDASADTVSVGTTLSVTGAGNTLTLDAASGVTYQKFAENGTGRFFLATLNGADGLAFVDADGSAERMRITADGDVGIGCTPSATDWGSAERVLQIAGTQPLFSFKETDNTKEFQIALSGGALYFWDVVASANRMLINTNGVIDGDFNDTSDIALKENIKELPSSLDVVNKLNPVSFDWKEDQRPSKGFIAQEVEAVDSTLAGGEEGSKSIKTSGIVAVLTKAVQELAEEVESLKNNKCKCEE